MRLSFTLRAILQETAVNLDREEVDAYVYAMTNGDEILALDSLTDGVLPTTTRSVVTLDSHGRWLS